MRIPPSATLSHRREAAQTDMEFRVRDFLWGVIKARARASVKKKRARMTRVTTIHRFWASAEALASRIPIFSPPATVPCSVSKITMFVQQSPLARGAKEGLKTFMPGTSLRPSARRRAFAWSCSITCAARGFTFQGKAGMMRRVGYGEECAKK